MKLFTTLFLTAIALINYSCSGRDNVTTDTTVLPPNAISVIKSNYADANIVQIEIERKAIGGDEYEVILANGTKIDFNHDGSIESVKAGPNGEVPLALVNGNVSKYLSANYTGQKVTEYDVDGKGIEVKLSSGIEVEFDSAGQFLRLDH